MDGVVDVELAGRGHQALVLDDLLQLEGLVVHDHQGRAFLSLPFQTENHTSSPALLYSGCTTRFGPFAQIRPFGDGQDREGGFQLVDIEHRDATGSTSSTELRAVST
jgi:hypothetical protein